MRREYTQNRAIPYSVGAAVSLSLSRDLFQKSRSNDTKDAKLFLGAFSSLLIDLFRQILCTTNNL